MALIQLEVLMVTLHKISCLLASVQTEMSICLLLSPFLGKIHYGPFTQINLLMRLVLFLDI